jgi:hypothetical protein
VSIESSSSRANSSRWALKACGSRISIVAGLKVGFVASRRRSSVAVGDDGRSEVALVISGRAFTGFIGP